MFNAIEECFQTEHLVYSRNAKKQTNVVILLLLLLPVPSVKLTGSMYVVVITHTFIMESPHSVCNATSSHIRLMDLHLHVPLVQNPAKKQIQNWDTFVNVIYLWVCICTTLHPTRACNAQQIIIACQISVNSLAQRVLSDQYTVFLLIHA